MISLKGTPQMKKKEFTLKHSNKIHCEDTISTSKLIALQNDNNNNGINTTKNNVIRNRNVNSNKPDSITGLATNNNSDNNNINSKESNKDLIDGSNADDSINSSYSDDGNNSSTTKRLDKVSNYARRIIDIQEDASSSQEELLNDINEEFNESVYEEQVAKKAVRQVNGDDNHSSNNHSKPIPKKFVLKESNASRTPNNSNEVKSHSTTNLKSGIHRKISRERTIHKNKILKHSSSLKDLQIHYSSNLHTRQKEKRNSCQSNEPKRVGLPAELFANDVSFRVRSDACQEALAADKNSFYSIQMNSPIGAYSNPYFQSDESLPTVTANALELPIRNDRSIEVERPKTAEKTNHNV